MFVHTPRSLHVISFHEYENHKPVVNCFERGPVQTHWVETGNDVEEAANEDWETTQHWLYERESGFTSHLASIYLVFAASGWTLLYVDQAHCGFLLINRTMLDITANWKLDLFAELIERVLFVSSQYNTGPLILTMDRYLNHGPSLYLSEYK